MPDPDIGRRSPYESVFHAEALDEGELAAIQAEAEEIGADLSVRSQFARVATASALLERMVPESFDTAALDRYLEILFHGFHFWRAGRPFYAFEADLVRRLIEEPPQLSGWRFQLPREAIYIELPKNLFWAAVTEAAPEPVEGVFVRSVGGQAGIDMLLVLGMWPDRPGFSAASLSVPEDAMRSEPEPDAFRSDLPGADRAGLYSIRRAGEAIALVARLVWYLDRHPAAVRQVAGDEGDGGENDERAARTTRLPYGRVALVEPGE